MDSGHDSETPLSELPSSVFVDTNVLLNFAYRGVEHDKSSHLFTNSIPRVVVGITVDEELADIRERRGDIYPDFLDFLLAEEGRIEEYDPNSRRPYFDANDRTHVEAIQMKLADCGTRTEIQTALRHFIQDVERRLDYLQEEVIPGALYDQQPSLTLMFALGDLIDNDNDRRVVGDAALWAAEESDSSGVLVTDDGDDLLDQADNINDTLRDSRGAEWQLLFVPTATLVKLRKATPGQE